MNTLVKRLISCCLLAAFTCVAHAEVGKRATLSALTSGKHISGPKCSESDLRGKVVFFEYWGINCPPCLAAMPHLQELYKKYQSSGFVIIGAHSQLPTPKVKEYLKSNKITFPIYQSASVPEAPCPGGLPYSVLIGANGKVVAEGRPSEIYGKVEEEVAKAEKGAQILDGVELKKYKSLSKTMTSKGNNIEGKIAPLRGKVDDAEAQAICEAYDLWLEEEKSRVENLCRTNPLKAMSAIRKLKVLVPSATDFDEQLTAFKNNEGLQKIAETGKKISSLQKMADKGRKVRPDAVKKIRKLLEGQQQDSDDEAVKASAAALLQELEGLEAQE